MNVPLLTEELFAAFPQWRRTVTDQTTQRQMVVSDAIITEVGLSFPDETDEMAVQAVVDAHDPAGLSVNQIEYIKEQAAGTEFDGMPDWLKNATYAGIEQTILDRTVGSTTKEQALAAVDAAASLADVKVILRKLVEAVYGLVEIDQKVVRVLLAVIFFAVRRWKHG